LTFLQLNRKVGSSGSVIPQGFILYNIVQFLMIDKDFSGAITIEEATDVLKSLSHGKDTQKTEATMRNRRVSLIVIEAALSKGYQINS
jgi:hypothetical protein